jgi:hypothetical protein
VDELKNRKNYPKANPEPGRIFYSFYTGYTQETPIFSG